MGVATKTYIKKTIERLYGIIEGISIDCTVNDKEIAALHNWMNSHEFLHHTEPFKGLTALLRDILADGVIDADEREELIEWCADTINDKGFVEGFTPAARRLHGIFSGIMCDQTIKTEELEGLQDWLLDYEEFLGWWPFNDLSKQIKSILKDGKIDKEEHEQLQIFFNDFAEHIIDDPAIHDDEYWMNQHVASPCPVFQSIKSICEKEPNIKFKDHSFCFTGPAATGKRKDLFTVVQQLGGHPENSAVTTLDYLVIGAQASPAWVYSTYGRKIEKVINRQRENPRCPTMIINEYDFVSAVTAKRGKDIIPDPYLPPF